MGVGVAFDWTVSEMLVDDRVVFVSCGVSPGEVVGEAKGRLSEFDNAIDNAEIDWLGPTELIYD